MIREDKTGMLYLCATPIGNLEDVTLRVLRILKEADVVAAEDTRQSIKLLNHYEIKTPLVSYHEHNKYEKTPVLVQRMLKGETIALVTDAGTPAISDPGEDLVRACYEAGIPVTSLPGPAACINALIISGLPTRRFVFEAFLPSDKKERAAVLEELSHETRTMIIYEAPHRLCRTLAELAEILGGDRQIAVCKELTKRHETVYRSDIKGAVDYYNANEPRGEYVLVIAGLNREDIIRDKQDAWKEMPLEEHLKHYESQGIERREAIKLVAKDRGVPKREIYNMTLNFPK